MISLSWRCSQKYIFTTRLNAAYSWKMSEDKIEIPSIKLTRNLEQEKTTYSRSLTAIHEALRFISWEGRREEVFPGMDYGMMKRFIANDERFDVISYREE